LRVEGVGLDLENQNVQGLGIGVLGLTWNSTILAIKFAEIMRAIRN